MLFNVEKSSKNSQTKVIQNSLRFTFKSGANKTASVPLSQWWKERTTGTSWWRFLNYTLIKKKQIHDEGDGQEAILSSEPPCVSSESFHWCPQSGSVIGASVAWLLLFFSCWAKPQPGRAEHHPTSRRRECKREQRCRILQPSSSALNASPSFLGPAQASAVQIWSDPQRLTSLFPPAEEIFGSWSVHSSLD